MEVEKTFETKWFAINCDKSKTIVPIKGSQFIQKILNFKVI